jgi:hypothetical protein
MSFNINPQPTYNPTALGMNVGAISAPPSIWEQTLAANPSFADMTKMEGDVVKSQLAGQLSPETMRSIGNYAASRGVSLGQPSSPLSNLIGMNVTGVSAEQLQQQGSQNYLNFLGTVGGMQNNPAMLAQIAETNAVNAAAPNPELAFNKAMQLYNQYSNPAGGTGGAGGGWKLADQPLQIIPMMSDGKEPIDAFVKRTDAMRRSNDEIIRARNNRDAAERAAATRPPPDFAGILKTVSDTRTPAGYSMFGGASSPYGSSFGTPYTNLADSIAGTNYPIGASSQGGDWLNNIMSDQSYMNDVWGSPQDSQQVQPQGYFPSDPSTDSSAWLDSVLSYPSSSY